MVYQIFKISLRAQRFGNSRSLYCNRWKLSQPTEQSEKKNQTFLLNKLEQAIETKIPPSTPITADPSRVWNTVCRLLIFWNKNGIIF